MARIDKLLDTSMSVTETSKDDIDDWAKDFCIKTVLKGANKMVSQKASITFYDAVFDDVKDYHSKVFKNVEVDGKSVPPPRKIKLNSHNINSVQSAILEAYKSVKSDANPFMALNGTMVGFIVSCMMVYKNFLWILIVSSSVLSFLKQKIYP